ncbi:hypothetical protein ACFQKF_12585 [Halalkalicoccus sp. GCM10025322]|uniref:hypothetical protein n=2 Tax=Halococcaceae TaxID=1963270 RepID=UPI002F96E193
MSDSQRSDATTYATGPPMHDGLPVIGNTHQLVREQEGLYETAARHGDVVHLRLLGIGDFYQVNQPELVERILVNDRDRFGRRV